MVDALHQPRLRQPDGCPWDREQTHESLRKHLLEEAYEVYDALEAAPRRAGRGARGPAAPGRPPRPARRRGRRLRPGRRPGLDRSQDRAPASPRLRRRRGANRRRRQPPVGADQGRRARRGRRDEPPATDVAAARRAEERPRWHQPVPAGPRREPGDAGARRGAGLRLAVVEGVLDKVAEELGELARGRRRRGTPGGVRGPPARRRQRRAEAGHRDGGRPASRERQVPAAVPARRAAVAERGVGDAGPRFEALDELWDAAKVEERGEVAR